jgi:hypothetical protein
MERAGEEAAGAVEQDGASAAGDVEVELFGVPRLLAGRRSLRARGATLGELAADLAGACPPLVGPVIDGRTGWLLSGYTFVLDDRFTTDPAATLVPTSSVLLVSSVAGC